MTLTNGTEYTVAYKNNTNAGTATVEITGINNYGSTIEKTFTISPANVTVPKAKTGLVYTGKSQTGVATGANYTVTNGSKTAAGTYSATVALKDKNNYSWADGTTKDKTVSWTIKKVALSSAKLNTTVYTWNGSAKKPAATVKAKVNGTTRTLKSGTDYTISYKKNKNVGKATVTVKGTGNYSGSLTKTFKINPKGTTLKAPSNYKKGKTYVTVKWTKQASKMSSSRITGYQIQVAANSKFTKNKKTVVVKGYDKTSKKITKLKGGKKYYVRIRTYKTVSGTKYYSPWSKVKTVTTKK